MDVSHTFQIGIFVFDQVEVLDFAGPYEVFTTASRVWNREHPADPARFNVRLLAESTSVRARAGLFIQSDRALEECSTFDLLVIPGGVVTEELEKPQVINWIRQAAPESIIASVCTGAFLLARAGLLDNRSATTHWEDIEELRTQFPAVNVLSQRRWVDEGQIISSAGISAGIDMSLHLVARLAGRELAVATARQMEFDWTQAN